MLNHPLGVGRACGQHHIPFALEVRVARQSNRERTIDRGEDTGKVNATDVRQFSKHGQQLLDLLELHKAITFHTHGKDIIHRVGDSLEHIIARFPQRGVEQLGILAILTRLDVGVHLNLVLVKIDFTSHRIDVTLGEYTNEGHLLRQFAVNLTLVEDAAQALSLHPRLDLGVIIVEHLFCLLVLGYAGRRLGQNVLGGLGCTRHLHGLVHGADKQHLAINDIEIIAHIHAIQSLNFTEVTSHTQFQRFAGLSRIFQWS